MRTGTPLAGAQAAEAQHARAVDDGLDRIELRGLAAHGYHGVHEHERRDGQRFVVDIVVHTDTRPAAADDDLSRTLDYGVLAGEVVAVLVGPPVALLETLAERIAATALAHPTAVAVDVTVHKPQAPLLDQPDAVSAAVEFADVVVSVRRDRTWVPVVDPAAQDEPAPRAGWASAAPAPALDVRQPDSPAAPVDDFVVPDMAPSAADLAAEPSVAPYGVADPVEELPADPGDGLAPVVDDGPEPADLPTGATDEPAAPGAEPSDQAAWDQSAWSEPMPPSIPPATVTPAPSSAGAVVVAPGLGPVVAQLAPDPAAAPAAQADDLPVVAPAPVVDEPVDALPSEAVDVAPEPFVTPEVAPRPVEAAWLAEAAPEPALPDRAVPDPVWVPAPAPQEAPQAQAAPPGWPSSPVAVPPSPEPLPWQNQAQPAAPETSGSASEAFGGPDPFGRPGPFGGPDHPAPFGAPDHPAPFGGPDYPAPSGGSDHPAPFGNPDPFGGPDPFASGSAEPHPAAPPFGAGPGVAESGAAWPEAPVAQPEAAAPWAGFPVEAPHPAGGAALPPWAVASTPPADPAPPAGEPWGSAPPPPPGPGPAVPGGWSPPPPPQWASFDPPSATPDSAGQVAAPSASSFGMPSPSPFDAPAHAAGGEALSQSPEALTEVVIGVGGNLGPVQETLRWAVLRLGAMTGLEVTAVGPLARTAAVGSTDQPDYLNTVVVARTLLSPRDLLRRLQGVEREAGRERLERWGPRTLDLDIISYGNLVASDDELTVPHPRAHERAFVLGPWAALDPDAVLPGPGGGPVSRLADQAPDADGVRWMALDWLTDTPGEPGAA